MSSKILITCLVVCYLLALSTDLASGQWYNYMMGGSSRCYPHMHPCIMHPQCCSEFCDIILRVCIGGG
ncbi:unnamed protein product [Allacma fusca]|uniref:Uncharacterized protein n=1 Tax=Allacma fusca TaxID=39272 RepID=A0A8J2M9E0_9HEXA|nr:unnamed protein product [Allacma fusca]